MILEVKNGCFGYPKQPEILKNINISLEEGKILAILGPNGIGKTTLLKCMIGLRQWRSGETLLCGKKLAELPQKKINITRKYGLAALANLSSFVLRYELSADIQLLRLPMHIVMA